MHEGLHSTLPRQPRERFQMNTQPLSPTTPVRSYMQLVTRTVAHYHAQHSSATSSTCHFHQLHPTTPYALKPLAHFHLPLSSSYHSLASVSVHFSCSLPHHVGRSRCPVCHCAYARLQLVLLARLPSSTSIRTTY